MSEQNVDDVSRVPCPGCGELALKIEMRLVPKPYGTYSIAGVQNKIVATEWPFLVCTNCGIEAKGKAEEE